MFLTENLLNCIKNPVNSDAAKLGGGGDLDKPTQKNKQIWTCLAILIREQRT